MKDSSIFSIISLVISQSKVISLSTRGSTLFATKPEIYPEGMITGYFGPLTEKAVQTFQLNYGVVSSKTNEPKFCKILSPKNSFAETSSALFRHLSEYLEGRTPKKNVLSFFKENFTPAKSRKQGTFFFGVAKCCEAVAERFIPHRDFVGKKFGFCSGDTAYISKNPTKFLLVGFFDM